MMMEPHGSRLKDSPDRSGIGGDSLDVSANFSSESFGQHVFTGGSVGVFPSLYRIDQFLRCMSPFPMRTENVRRRANSSTPCSPVSTEITAATWLDRSSHWFTTHRKRRDCGSLFPFNVSTGWIDFS